MGMIGNSLAQGLISGANIQDGTVDTADIKDSAVTAAKIASGVVTPAKMDFSAGTANGVLYLNGSKVASSGSVLVFDGTNFGVGETSPASKIHITASTAPTSGSMLRLDNTATTNYSATAYVGGQIRLNYTNATSRYGGINFSNNGATSQEFFGVVQNASGYGDFVWQGYGGSGYVERARIDSSGNLLVGTTTLSFSANSQYVLDGVSATNSTPNNAGVLVSRTTGASGESLALRVKSGAGISGTTFPAQVVSAGNNVFEFYTTGAAPIVFGTNNTDRARITAAGDFDLYITGPKDGQLRWTAGGGGSVQAYIYANGYPELIAQCGGSGGVKLTSGATSWVSASDIRSKDIIEHITDAITKVTTLSSIIYSFKDDEQQTRRVGLVAQELLEVLPEAVYVPTKEEELLGVRYAEVVPLLVAAIKELNTRLAALEGA